MGDKHWMWQGEAEAGVPESLGGGRSMPSTETSKPENRGLEAKLFEQVLHASVWCVSFPDWLSSANSMSSLPSTASFKPDISRTVWALGWGPLS